jgi:hypothetical protein
MRTTFLIALVVVLVPACGGGSDSEEPEVGPCVHKYLEPVVLIDSVKDSASGSSIPSVSIDAISIRGVSLSPAEVTRTARNLVLEGMLFTCTLPCGFGQDEAPHQFRVQASGFKPQTVSVNAVYRVSSGVCPSSSTGGTQVSIILERA